VTLIRYCVLLGAFSYLHYLTFLKSVFEIVIVHSFTVMNLNDFYNENTEKLKLTA